MPLRPRSPSPHMATPSVPVADPPRATSRRPIYVCAAAEIIIILGGAICSVPWTRLLESAVCRRHYAASGSSEGAPLVVAGSLADLLRGVLSGTGPGAEMDESLCKGDNVQAEMAELMGSMASFAIIPSLLVTIPYSMLAKKMDRRIILLVNIVSTVIAMLFMIGIACYPESNLQLLWLTGFFDFIGGGGPVLLALLRSIIAESVEAGQLSSVLYTLSSIHMIARLGGVILGAWLLKNGAASAMLIGVSVTSTIIPILSFLPRSAAHSPESGKFQRISTTNSADYSSNRASNVPSPRLSPEPPDEEEDLIAREQPVNSLRERLTPTKRSRKAFSALIRKVSTIPLDNPVFPICLAIMFLNGLAMDARGQLRPWTSKRYNWTLTTVGYVLSFESFLGVGILFALPWFDRVRRPLPQSSTAGPHMTASDDAQPIAEEEAIAATRAVLAKRRRELLVARISLGLGAVGALVLALAADRVAFVIGIGLMTGAVGFPSAIRAFFTSRFATTDIQGLYASITVVETLSVIMGSPIWGRIYAHAYRGGSAWIGAPFGVCSVLLVCTLGLVLGLRV